MATKQRSNSKPSQPRGGSNQSALETVQGYIKEWEDYRKKLLPSWERDNKLYNNERYQRKFEGVSDTFVPMTFSTIETIVSAIVTGDLNTDFLPQDIYKYLKDRLESGFDPEIESQEDYLTRALNNAISGGIIEDESLEVLNALYDYYWDSGDWDIAIEHLVRSGVKIGNGSLWCIWENNKPELINVPFPDYVFDPRSKDDDSSRFAGRRYLTSLGALKSVYIIDPATGKKKQRYNNLADVQKKNASGDDQRSDKELKEKLLLGSTLDVKSDSDGISDNDQVEVIEIMTPQRMYTLVNRMVLAEDEENFIITQARVRGLDTTSLITIPGITWSNYKDESLLIGKSETSTFWQEQERLNDSTNQKGDAVTRALLQNYRADPSLKSQKNSFSVPGAVIWSSANQYEAIPPAMVPSAAFNEEMSIKNNIREATATDQIVKGVGSATDVTATEAKLQVAQSGQRVQMKIRSLERGPLKRLARIVLQYVRLFVADPFIVPQQASGGLKPLLFDPNKYDFEIEPKVTLTIDAKDNKKIEAREALQTYQVLIQDPTNNLEEVKKIYLPKISGLDKDEVQRIMQPQQKMMSAADPAGGKLDAGGVLPPGAMAMPQSAPQGMSA